MIKYPFTGKGFSEGIDYLKSYSKEFLISLYYSMLRIRRIELEIEAEYHKDQMKSPIHLAIGQEANSVGACAALKSTDKIWLSHRTHGHYLAKGGSLNAMLAELHCKIGGCVASRGGSMHLIDKAKGVAGSSAIVGGILPIAAGAALAAKMLKKRTVHVVFFGDATTEEGVAHETINLAILWRLPIVFFCENNFYSVCSPLSKRQPSIEIWRRAESFGIASKKLDGTNVLEVFESTKKAVDYARSGEGPYFLESIAYRLRAHGGAGDDSHSGYRDPAEWQDWNQMGDPLNNFEEFLLGKNLLNTAHKEKLEKQIKEELLAAFEFARTNPEPGRDQLGLHVYSE